MMKKTWLMRMVRLKNDEMTSGNEMSVTETDQNGVGKTFIGKMFQR